MAQQSPQRGPKRRLEAFYNWTSLAGVAVSVGVLAALILPVPYGRAESKPTKAETNTCVACHRTAAAAASFGSRTQDQFLHWYGAVHGRKGVTCENCHGGDPKNPDKNGAHRGVLSTRDPKSPVYFKNVPRTCGRCHREVFRQFTTSKHYRDLKNDSRAPICITCHGFKMDIDVINPLQIAGRCSLCHNNTESGVEPDVAEEARNALEQVLQTKTALDEASVAVKFMGDPGSPATDAIIRRVEEGRQQLKFSAPHWHAFDLGKFATELTAIQASAREARDQALAKIREKTP